MIQLILPFSIGLLGAVSIAFVIAYLNLRGRTKIANIEGDEMVQDATLNAESRLKTLEADLKDEADDALAHLEMELTKSRAALEDREDILSQKQKSLDDALEPVRRKLQSREDTFKNFENTLNAKSQRVKDLVERERQIKTKMYDVVKGLVQVPIETLQAQVEAQLKQEAKSGGVRQAEMIEQNAEVQAERDAKRVLAIVLNRFARPYCAERGISNVHFENEAVRNKIFGPQNELKAFIEKTCGVDVVFNFDYNNAAVMGFDPVRRELGRLVLDGLSRDRTVDENRVLYHYDKCKKQLFKKILNDGNRIAKELSIKDFHESIRSMLGALRYRYSYSQNQYFHVGEVGWLCGLMSAELGLVVERGRRSGVLHDIGKAMDHSKEGGHAVIGAEFIQAHNEKPDVVHAVKAHHFDETPSSDLAYLTIAADAISGARPGARRSTADSYSQKMADLEKIGSSFPEVNGTYVLSAGRELRLFVDSRDCDDQRALELSKQVAARIEDECNYPGTIKVTVVRQIQAVEYAQ